MASRGNATAAVPLLYWSNVSVWASVAGLCLLEKGYSQGDIEMVHIDIPSGNNFHPSFLSINPSGTVPTLIVHDTESSTYTPGTLGFKALTDTKSIVLYLASRRRSMPSLVPLPHLMARCDNLIDFIHTPALDPNFLSLSACTRVELSARAAFSEAYLRSRQAALDHFSDTSIPDRRLWFSMKADANRALLDVFLQHNSEHLTDEAARKRDEFFKASEKAWEVVGEALKRFEEDIEGPWVLGEDLTVCDLHLCALLARIVDECGGAMDASGIDSVAAKVGVRPGPNVAAYWRRWTERPSFRQIYPVRLIPRS